MADVTGTTATSAATGTRYAMNSGGKVSEDKTNLKNQDFLQLYGDSILKNGILQA